MKTQTDKEFLKTTDKQNDWKKINNLFKKIDTPRTDKASFYYDTFNGVDPWEGERYIKVVPAKISEELECEVKILQEIKRKYEVSELLMAQEIDTLFDALSAMNDYYKECMITPSLYKQVDAALSLSNHNKTQKGNEK
jgi:hypothetical protein